MLIILHIIKTMYVYGLCEHVMVRMGYREIYRKSQKIQREKEIYRRRVDKEIEEEYKIEKQIVGDCKRYTERVREYKEKKKYIEVEQFKKQ